MKLSAILFDLDGTLLPMDNDHFTEVYFSYLARAAYPWGYRDSKQLVAAIWKGVSAMVKNDGSRSNSQAFWEVFQTIMARDAAPVLPKFSSFYETDFHNAKEATQPTPLAREAVRQARAKAQYVILATNPIFPRNADETRLSWLGLCCDDFDLVTDYDNSGFCKPNPEYYLQILREFDIDPASCLMIGNDVDEDILAAEEAGIHGFLLTDHVINRQERAVSCPSGNYGEMLEYLREL